MKNRSVYPYRRNGSKGRPNPGGGGRRGRDNSGRSGDPANEILSQLQPTTKALAQMLSGNTKASGQISHARSILVRAQKLVDDRAVERLRPQQREEYLEQLARLKLTLTDAQNFDADEKPEPDSAVAAAVPIDKDRLRELALSIAVSTNQPTETELVEPSYIAFSEPELPPSRAAGQALTSEPGEPAEDIDFVEDDSERGDRRKRLRLKPSK